ncbi:MAG: hypothetical protein FWF07_00830 [Methanomassiliicoccaceae archaeon]|nr:hypothetical protein [Methanomassiliicoccaceae archaeon]
MDKLKMYTIVAMVVAIAGFVLAIIGEHISSTSIPTLDEILGNPGIIDTYRSTYEFGNHLSQAGFVIAIAAAIAAFLINRKLLRKQSDR